VAIAGAVGVGLISPPADHLPAKPLRPGLAGGHQVLDVEMPAHMQGTSKNAVHGILLHGKAKNAVFASLHFQSLAVI
jgi:hypothetical protein